MQRKVLLFIMCLCFTTVSYAQVALNSVEDAWRYADKHNVTIRTAKYETEKALYAKRSAFGTVLPQASASGSFTYNANLQTTLIPLDFINPNAAPGAYEAIQFGQRYIYTGGLTGQLDIVNLQNWFNVAIAKRNEDYNKASLANTRKNVYQQIASQYYSYLLMQEAATLAAQTASIADSVYQSANNKFKEGTINEANLDVAKLNLERAEQTAITAHYQMMTTCNNLKALLDMTVSDSINVGGSLQSNLATADEASFQQDPSIMTAFYQQKINLQQYHYANAAFAPVISVIYSYNTQQNNNDFKPFTADVPWYPASYWSVRATLPLFTGGSRFFTSKKTKVAYEESKMQYDNAVKQSAINDVNIRLNYTKAVEVLAKAKDVMVLGFDNYSHISYRYAAGITTMDDRLNAFSDYITYQNQYLNSLSDLLIQLYQLKIRQQSF